MVFTRRQLKALADAGIEPDEDATYEQLMGQVEPKQTPPKRKPRSQPMATPQEASVVLPNSGGRPEDEASLPPVSQADTQDLEVIDLTMDELPDLRTPKRRGRPAKTPLQNTPSSLELPASADVSVSEIRTPKRRGRPPKVPSNLSELTETAASTEVSLAEIKTPKRRGRPAKASSNPDGEMVPSAEVSFAELKTPKRRGRPPKTTEANPGDTSQILDASLSELVTPKKRGRPSKASRVESSLSEHTDVLEPHLHSNVPATPAVPEPAPPADDPYPLSGTEGFLEPAQAERKASPSLDGRKQDLAPSLLSDHEDMDSVSVVDLSAEFNASCFAETIIEETVLEVPAESSPPSQEENTTPLDRECLEVIVPAEDTSISKQENFDPKGCEVTQENGPEQDVGTIAQREPLESELTPAPTLGTQQLANLELATASEGSEPACQSPEAHAISEAAVGELVPSTLKESPAFWEQEPSLVLNQYPSTAGALVGSHGKALFTQDSPEINEDTCESNLLERVDIPSFSEVMADIESIGSNPPAIPELVIAHENQAEASATPEHARPTIADLEASLAAMVKLPTPGQSIGEEQASLQSKETSCSAERTSSEIAITPTVEIIGPTDDSHPSRVPAERAQWDNFVPTNENTASCDGTTQPCHGISESNGFDSLEQIEVTVNQTCLESVEVAYHAPIDSKENGPTPLAAQDFAADASQECPPREVRYPHKTSPQAISATDLSARTTAQIPPEDSDLSGSEENTVDISYDIPTMQLTTSVEETSQASSNFNVQNITDVKEKVPTNSNTEMDRATPVEETVHESADTDIADAMLTEDVVQEISNIEMEDPTPTEEEGKESSDTEMEHATPVEETVHDSADTDIADATPTEDVVQEISNIKMEDLTPTEEGEESSDTEIDHATLVEETVHKSADTDIADAKPTEDVVQEISNIEMEDPTPTEEEGEESSNTEMDHATPLEETICDSAYVDTADATATEEAFQSGSNTGSEVSTPAEETVKERPNTEKEVATLAEEAYHGCAIAEAAMSTEVAFQENSNTEMENAIPTEETAEESSDTEMDHTTPVEETLHDYADADIADATLTEDVAQEISNIEMKDPTPTEEAAEECSDIEMDHATPVEETVYDSADADIADATPTEGAFQSGSTTGSEVSTLAEEAIHDCDNTKDVMPTEVAFQENSNTQMEDAAPTKKARKKSFKTKKKVTTHAEKTIQESPFAAKEVDTPVEETIQEISNSPVEAACPLVGLELSDEAPGKHLRGSSTCRLPDSEVNHNCAVVKDQIPKDAVCEPNANNMPLPPKATQKLPSAPQGPIPTSKSSKKKARKRKNKASIDPHLAQGAASKKPKHDSDIEESPDLFQKIPGLVGPSFIPASEKPSSNATSISAPQSLPKPNSPSDSEDEIDASYLESLLSQAKASAPKTAQAPSATKAFKNGKFLDPVSELVRKNLYIQDISQASKKAIPSGANCPPIKLQGLDTDKVKIPDNHPSCLSIGAALTADKQKGVQELKMNFDLAHKPSKAEKAKLKDSNAGAKWFNMPAPVMTPELKRDLELLSLRNVLDKKRFYKKSDKQPTSKFLQVGTIIEDKSEFYSARMTKKERQPTMVAEVLNDATAQDYFKSRFDQIQQTGADNAKQPSQKRFKKKHSRQ